MTLPITLTDTVISALINQLSTTLRAKGFFTRVPHSGASGLITMSAEGAKSYCVVIPIYSLAKGTVVSFAVSGVRNGKIVDHGKISVSDPDLVSSICSLIQKDMKKEELNEE